MFPFETLFLKKVLKTNLFLYLSKVSFKIRSFADIEDPDYDPGGEENTFEFEFFKTCFDPYFYRDKISLNANSR